MDLPSINLDSLNGEENCRSEFSELLDSDELVTS